MRKLLCPVHLEMKPDFCGQSSRRHVVSSAESGKEVVERHFVGQIDSGKSQAPLVTVAAEEVVFTHGDVEQISRRNARRVVIGAFGAGRGNGYVLGTIH